VCVETDGSGISVFVKDILRHIYNANISMMRKYQPRADWFRTSGR